MNTTPSFTRRFKAAIAGAAFAALAFFGVVGMDAPEPADHEAGGTWSFTIGGDDDGKRGPGASTQGMTWS